MMSYINEPVCSVPATFALRRGRPITGRDKDKETMPVDLSTVFRLNEDLSTNC